MKQMIESILTDVKARTAESAERAAVADASEFFPWAD